MNTRTLCLLAAWILAASEIKYMYPERIRGLSRPASHTPSQRRGGSAAFVAQIGLHQRVGMRLFLPASSLGAD